MSYVYVPSIYSFSTTYSGPGHDGDLLPSHVLPLQGYVIPPACSGSATRASSQFNVSRKHPDQMPAPPLPVPFTAKVQPCVTKQDTLLSPQTSLGKVLLSEASDGLPELKLTKNNSQRTHQAHATHEF